LRAAIVGFLEKWFGPGAAAPAADGLALDESVRADLRRDKSNILYKN
jgi:hypothetical protein